MSKVCGESFSPGEIQHQNHSHGSLSLDTPDIGFQGRRNEEDPRPGRCHDLKLNLWSSYGPGWKALLGEMYVLSMAPEWITALLELAQREVSGRIRFWLLVKAGEWSIRERIPVHNYYLLLLNNTICCAPVRFMAIYNIDMILALPNQYRLLRAMEMTFVLYLPPCPTFKMGAIQSGT